jgi:hypothetical protein
MDTRRLLLSELSVRQVPRSKPAHLSTPKSPYPVAPSYRIRSICDCAGCADQDRPIGIARERASPASMGREKRAVSATPQAPLVSVERSPPTEIAVQ